MYANNHNNMEKFREIGGKLRMKIADDENSNGSRSGTSDNKDSIISK